MRLNARSRVLWSILLDQVTGITRPTIGKMFYNQRLTQRNRDKQCSYGISTATAIIIIVVVSIPITVLLESFYQFSAKFISTLEYFCFISTSLTMWRKIGFLKFAILSSNSFEAKVPVKHLFHLHVILYKRARVAWLLVSRSSMALQQIIKMHMHLKKFN